MNASDTFVMATAEGGTAITVNPTTNNPTTATGAAVTAPPRAERRGRGRTP